MQGGNRPEVHAQHGTHGIPVNGDGTGGCGMGTAQDIAPGKRNPAIDEKGGEDMTDAQLDAIKAAEDAFAWEALNKDNHKWEMAIAFLRQAAMAFVEAESYLQSAAEAVEDTPETDRIAALDDAAQDIEHNVRAQIERMK
jgi:hypothetical protein